MEVIEVVRRVGRRGELRKASFEITKSTRCHLLVGDLDLRRRLVHVVVILIGQR